ncbi:transmembrane protein [Legionella rubrilucens]|uniref:Transmembrane protein n=1 Tax=Legionella rubrilucens TaxID=458 RepID=A0A0W0XMX2_9GAMM|nr:nodulation protein NfeD [Legionella rubrilucens]KTD45779.1 transmembrane protein [Legionella rubrilucens]
MNPHKRRAFLVKWVICLTLLLIPAITYAEKIIVLNVEGAIGPAMADYIHRGITQADKASLIILRINTPGGLDKSLRLIVQTILSSKTPVVAYVAPNGARAASAGTYILYASTLAAMAPGTHLGAASPVQIGEQNKDTSDKNNSTLGKKVANDAQAYIRTLAQLRGRDPQFAEKAVTDAATMTAQEALKAGVINFIADNETDLLQQLQGQVVMQNGMKIQLDTENKTIERIHPDWRTQLLLIITEPTIAYLLLLLGIYGIFFELMNPGFVLPGVIGAIAMLLALYALQLLPVSYAGLGLILIGIVFIIAEAFSPSFGALGIGGSIAFIFGSILLIDTDHQSYQVAWSAIWAMAVVNVLVLFTLLGMTIKSRRHDVQHGLSVLVGAEGRAMEDIDLQGQAVIRGEIWNVHASQPIGKNKKIKVIAAKGLLLEVKEMKPAKKSRQENSNAVKKQDN